MLFSNMEIKKKEGDAPEFIGMLNKIMITMIWQYRVDEVCKIRIKNWFDHKWLNYSGKGIVPFAGGGIGPENAYEDRWKEKLTVPPFHPNKVESETFFRRKKTGNRMFEKPLHTTRNMFENLQNRITDKTRNGLFVWFSSQSKKNKKGSLMVYRVQAEEVETFYCSFENNGEWALNKAKGIDRNEVLLYLSDKNP